MELLLSKVMSCGFSDLVNEESHRESEALVLLGTTIHNIGGGEAEVTNSPTKSNKTGFRKSLILAI